MKLADPLIIATGLLLLGLGIYTVIWPEIFSSLYGVEMPNGAAIGAIRAIIGGGEIALGFTFVIGRRFGFPKVALLWLGMVLFCCLATVRVFHVFFGDDLPSTFFVELCVEAIWGVVFAALWWRNYKLPQSASVK